MENDMATNTNMGNMLTVREVSQLLHVHSNTLRRWSDQGIIKAYRIGPRGDRRFRAEDIAVLLLDESKGVQFNGGKRN
jgi:excisionase family DNA binding protein